VREVRQALGDAFKCRQTVVVAIFNAECWPVITPIELVGNGRRWLLRCPSCGVGCMVLRASGLCSVGCNACVRHRRRKERERTLRSWVHFDGALEDRLVRAAFRNCPAWLRARNLMALSAQLLEGDRDRAAAVLQHSDAARSVADDALVR